MAKLGDILDTEEREAVAAEPSEAEVKLLRPFRLTRHFTEMTPGSVLIEMGKTKVLCTASFEERVPPWMRGQGTGWLTAEYAMLPGCSTSRIKREQYNRGRALEISRLIGRSIRAVTDLKAMGERMLHIDCDVLQADGGTRTASVNGSWVAVWDACRWGKEQGWWQNSPLYEHMAALSVGIVENQLISDLNYEQDSQASVDLNVVMAARNRLVEVQGTAEHAPFSREKLNGMLDLAGAGISQIIEYQTQIVADDS